MRQYEFMSNWGKNNEIDFQDIGRNLLDNENKYMDTQLKKRIKSLVWRAVMMGIATVITVITESLTGLGLPIWITGILGLVLGEVSKFLNTGIK